MDRDSRPLPMLALFALLGLVAAIGQIVSGVETEVVAITVVAAATCYLAAAALERPWVAWVTILGASVVVVVSEAIGLPWWVGVGLTSVVLVAVAVLRRASSKAVGAQALALLVFGGIAVLSVYLSATAGLLLVGVALAAHAIWDVAHWRSRTVVPRSLAEFCVLLDVPLGTAAVVVALNG